MPRQPAELRTTRHGGVARRLAVEGLVAALFVLGAAGLGLGFNALRPKRLPWVAAFPYQQDCPEKAKVVGKVVTAAEAIGLAGDRGVLFIDARPEEDFAAAHLPGARSLPLSMVAPVTAQQAASLKKFRLVVVYCDSPEDRIAALQAQQLRDAGLTAVSVLRGGYPGYLAASGGGK